MKKVKAWITIDEENRVLDVDLGKVKPVPVHSWCKAVKGFVVFNEVKKEIK